MADSRIPSSERWTQVHSLHYGQHPRRTRPRQIGLKPNAGGDILRYIRGRRLDQIPVLVFTALSIPYTTYVKDFNLAGSTVRVGVVEEYIKGLMAKREDLGVWAKFDA
jgi:hypothetical protein